MPSNGTEGIWFTSKFCDTCMFQHPDPNSNHQCNDVLIESLLGNQPDEWIYDSLGHPTCTKYVNWDWGNENDGWNDPHDPDGPLAPINPSQLLIPFDTMELFGFYGKDIAVTKTAIIEITS